jgi:hypothetical protein
MSVIKRVFNMPNIKGKNFPYTKKGMDDAEAYAKSLKKKKVIPVVKNKKAKK